MTGNTPVQSEAELPPQPQEALGQVKPSWLQVGVFTAASFIIGRFNEIAAVALAKNNVVSKTGGALIAGLTNFVSGVLGYYGLYDAHDIIKQKPWYQATEGVLLGALGRNPVGDGSLSQAAVDQQAPNGSPQKA